MVDVKERTCCFTGHREIPEESLMEIKQRLEEQVVRLIQQGVIYYGAGGALGFDTLAAQTILALKNAYPQVKLILVLPCQNQSERWNRADRAIYEGILAQADKVVYISEHYYKGCMHKRNRHLVDCSDYCICYLNRLSGGTYYTVRYAREKGLKIINCAEQLG